MADTELSLQPFSGPLSKIKKNSLVQIATALGLPSSGTVKELTLAIKNHLQANEEQLNKDPRFQGLYQYRPSITSGGLKAGRKTSADKAKEDAEAHTATSTLPPPYVSITTLMILG